MNSLYHTFTCMVRRKGVTSSGFDCDVRVLPGLIFSCILSNSDAVCTAQCVLGYT